MMIKIKEIFKKLTRNSWEIGFVVDGLQGVFSDNPRYVWVQNPYNEDCWFADPFILEVTSEYIILLVEEMRYATRKGRIAKLIINRNTMTIEKMDIILEENTHLSFPNIWREGAEIYVYPENHENGELNLYKLIDNASLLKKVRRLCKAPLTDAVMIEKWGKKQIFSTKMPNPNGDELYIYTLDTSFEITKSERVQFDDKHARMAGQFFEYKGRLYRPAQDCNRLYGEAVIIEEVISNGNKLDFVPVKRLTSRHPRLRQGMHTLNTYNGVVVVDVKGYRHILGSLLYQCVLLKKRIKKILRA